MSENKEREAFEAAWSTKYHAHGRTAFRRSEIVPGGYVNTRVNDGWSMWQARAALSTAAHGVGGMSDEAIRKTWITKLGYSITDPELLIVRSLLRPAPEPVAAPAIPEAWTNLLAYVLQDDLHNRLTPRVIDIAYSAFMAAKVRGRDEKDWFNDTRPMVLEAIAKIRKDLAEDRAAPASGEAGAQMLPERVIDVLWQQAGLTTFHPDGDQLQKFHDFANLVAAEVSARLPAAPIAADHSGEADERVTDEQIRAIAHAAGAGIVAHWGEWKFQDSEVIAFARALLATPAAASDMGQDCIEPDCPHDTCDPSACNRATPPAAGADDSEIIRLRKIAALIGNIFVHGDFKAETFNERELEKLLRAQGTFFESLDEFDAALRAGNQGERNG